MTPVTIPLHPDLLNQTLILSLSPDNMPFRLTLNLRFHESPEKWFLSLSDPAAGKLLVNSVPIVSSMTAINDFLTPFRHLVPGSLFLISNTKNPSSPDPGKTNLSEFDLVWMDCQDG